ncbi:MAG: family hydrolase [Marmoricola sp.]|nr:family hydrolase [Marmoricola sp.]
MSLETMIAEIHAGPSGPEIGAFFDFDGTVISGYSATAFLSHRLKAGEIGVGELASTVLAGVRGVHSAEDFVAVLEPGLRAWAGRNEEDLNALGKQLFIDVVASQLHTEVWQIVQAHHDKGHTVVLASSATPYQAEPMAQALDAAHLLCTRPEVVDGLLTGAVDGTPLWGPAKADAVRDLAKREKIDLKRSHAYSNGAEDIPFLNTVGRPAAVEPDARLRDEAVARDWPILSCTRRSGAPVLADVARTVGFYGAFGVAFGAGLGLGLLNQSREQIVDVTCGVGSDVGLALAGIDVKVISGDEHLWANRPCVFVFNHQSKIDPIVAMKLLRTGWTGVTKKEVRNIPGFGQLFQIAGVAFIDRSNTAAAIQALQPAVDKLRNGVSLAIAPEGTRSPTPKLGPFKKGAFHIAMQAGVPIVPVVLHGAGEVMWRGAQTMRPGTIEVVVLPPIPTDDWSVETINDHVDDVRQQFVKTLAQWPATHHERTLA